MDELFFEDCYNDDEDYDSEDSNQENYYTNEYPDDDDAGAVGSDEELCQQMNKFMFGRSPLKIRFTTILLPPVRR